MAIGVRGQVTQTKGTFDCDTHNIPPLRGKGGRNHLNTIIISGVDSIFRLFHFQNQYLLRLIGDPESVIDPVPDDPYHLVPAV